MIRYELKDKDKQAKYLALFPDFLMALNDVMEDRDPTKGYVTVKSGCYEYSINVYFEEVEGHEEYSPDQWNEFPAVKPPEGVKMRVEYYNGSREYTGGIMAVYSDGEWRTSDTDGRGRTPIAAPNVKRFRPWVDEE